MSESARAIFLSYAREDTDAARRIADALRSHGVEAWFDQSELRGGDAWDAKIRKQIKDCALFMPVISAKTQERGEGYFRLEWKLAVERTHLMVAGTPFLMPVVVDNTPEDHGMVPDEFMRVQWTRLPGALPTPQFVEQVKRLLEPRTGTRKPGVAEPARVSSEPETPVRSATSGGLPGWTWGALVAVVVAIAAGVIVSRKPAPPAAEAKAAPVEAKPAPAPVAPAVSEKSIAVLPFTNMSEEKDSAFFTDGIHEDILTHLALIQDLKVVSRTTAMQYRDTKKSLRQIGEELGVAYILEGSVRRAGNKVRVTGQLINARTDEHVWAKAYDRDLTDIFAIQAELATEIAGSLQAALSPQAQKFIERSPTKNFAAYDLFLKGRDVQNRTPSGQRSGLKQAEEYFRGAVDLDPNFAAAWGGLAEVHALHAFWFIDATPARLAEADAAMAQAVRLAPDAPEIIRAQGTYAYYAYRDYERALAQYEKIARLQPNDPTVFGSLGLILRRQGHWTEAMVNLRKALDLDPGNAAYVRNYLQLLVYIRRWDEAFAMQQRLIAMLPERRLQERIAYARLAWTANGSTREADELLASLTPAEFDSPRVVVFRRLVASMKGDHVEYRRLEARQPFFDDDGLERSTQAIFAADELAGHGDLPAAKARLADYPAELRARLEREPSNPQLHANLADMEAVLGHSEEALRLGHRAVELMPESRDTVDGPNFGFDQTRVLAWTGDKGRALAEIARLLRIPCNMDVHNLRIDPLLISLRGDPRFEALLNDPKNNAPLF